MNGPGGGLAITPIYGYAFLLVLVVAAVMAVIIVWQRTNYRAADATQALIADVDTGFRLLSSRIEAVAPAVAAAGVAQAAQAVGNGQATQEDPSARQIPQLQGDRPAQPAPPLPADQAGPAGQAAQALADARERLAAAIRQRSEAPDAAVSRACRRILLEGLTAVWEAESLTGQPTGPPIPSPTDAPLVDSPVRVVVDGAEHVALPTYAPGYPYCYSGGVFDVGEAPGGWYATPFWEELLERGAAADPD